MKLIRSVTARPAAALRIGGVNATGMVGTSEHENSTLVDSSPYIVRSSGGIYPDFQEHAR
jgi:hypothetical protein